MIVFPVDSGIYALNRWLESLDTWFRLYTTALTIDEDTTLDDLPEPSFPGYSSVRVRSWTEAIAFMGTPTAWADPIVWTCAAQPDFPDICRGYCVVDGQRGPLVWVEAFADAVTINGPGLSVGVQPRVEWAALP